MAKKQWNLLPKDEMYLSKFEDAVPVIKALLQNNNAVLVTQEEGATILNWIWTGEDSPCGDRSEVVFVDRCSYEDHECYPEEWDDYDPDLFEDIAPKEKKSIASEDKAEDDEEEDDELSLLHKLITMGADLAELERSLFDTEKELKTSKAKLIAVPLKDFIDDLLNVELRPEDIADINELAEKLSREEVDRRNRETYDRYKAGEIKLPEDIIKKYEEKQRDKRIQRQEEDEGIFTVKLKATDDADELAKRIKKVQAEYEKAYYGTTDKT